MFHLEVPGKPQQKGSKNSFAGKRKDGTIYHGLNESNKHAKGYQQLVRMMAANEWDGDLIQGAVRVDIHFEYSRPKKHFFTGKRADVLRPDAPDWKITMPDIDKLTRTVLDALSGVVFRDDSQVAAGHIEKGYRDGKEGDRTLIWVCEL